MALYGLQWPSMALYGLKGLNRALKQLPESVLQEPNGLLMSRPEQQICGTSCCVLRGYDTPRRFAALAREHLIKDGNTSSRRKINQEKRKLIHALHAWGACGPGEVDVPVARLRSGHWMDGVQKMICFLLSYVRHSSG